MNEFCVVGVTWRFGDTQALESYTVPKQDQERFLAALPARIGATEAMYLATCNRVEIILVSDGETPLPEYRVRVHELLKRERSVSDATRELRSWVGEGAIEHLLLVAAGLDSAQIGEHEIPGQLKQAVAQAEEAGTLGPRLDWLMREVLRSARSIRMQSKIGDGRVSLAEIALDRVEQRLGKDPSTGANNRRGRIALVGVSPMTERCGERLASSGRPIVVVNRREERARGLAESVGGTTQSLEAFCQHPDAVDVVVSATGSPDTLLKCATLEKLAARSDGRGPLLVDLAIPPDIDSQAAAKIGLEYVGMDEITKEAGRNSEKRKEDAAFARELVDTALDELRSRYSDRALAPVFTALGDRYRETATVGIDRLIAKELDGLTDDDRESLQRWAETLVRRLGHIPMVGLKAIANEFGMEPVRAFLEASGDPILGAALDAAHAVPESSPERDDP